MPTLIDRVVFYRFFLVSLIFGSAAAMVLSVENGRLTQTVVALTAPIVIETTLSVLYLVMVVRFPALRLSKVFLAVQYVLDAAILAIPIAFTEGIASPFVVLFALLIVVASITHSTRFALTMSLLVTALLAGLTFLQVDGHLPGTTPPDRFELVGSVLVKNVTYFGLFLLLALVPGRVVERLRRTDRALEYVRRDYSVVRELYRLVVEHVPSGIALVERSGNLVLLNRSGRHILAGLGADERRELIATLIESAEQDQNELEIEVGDAGLRIIGFSVAELDPDYALDGWLVVFQDVTRRKNLEQDLEEQKRLGAIGQLAAHLAHELRNPLAAISSSMQMLGDGDAIDETTSELVHIQEREVKRLQRLVTDFLQYAQPDRCTAEPVDIRKITETNLQRVREHPDARQCRFELIAPDLPIWAKADRELLRQALSNLILNAAQWSPDDEPIRIEVERDDDVVPGAVIIRVVDQGPGVSPDLREKLFEPFVGRRKGGTGLGLAIVRTSLLSQGGDITLTDPGPGGTVFELRLPLAEGQPEKQPEAAEHG